MTRFPNCRSTLVIPCAQLIPNESEPTRFGGRQGDVLNGRPGSWQSMGCGVSLRCCCHGSVGRWSGSLRAGFLLVVQVVDTGTAEESCVSF